MLRLEAVRDAAETERANLRTVLAAAEERAQGAPRGSRARKSARDASEPVLPDHDAPLRPDPSSAGDAASFIELLRQFRIWAGNPSYRNMAARDPVRGEMHAAMAALAGSGRAIDPLTVDWEISCGRERSGQTAGRVPAESAGLSYATKIAGMPLAGNPSERRTPWRQQRERDPAASRRPCGAVPGPETTASRAGDPAASACQRPRTRAAEVRPRVNTHADPASMPHREPVLARYQEAWWIAYEGRWLHVAGEPLQTNLDRMKARLASTGSATVRLNILRQSLSILATLGEASEQT